jgi:hypothetical protein
MKRRIMRRFRLDEISAVDRPAQEHARMTLIKRNEGQEQDDMRLEKITRDEPLSFATFEAAVVHLRELHECSRASAMSAAADRYPDLLRKYNDEGAERVEKAAQEATRISATSEAEQNWNMLVSNIMDRDKVSRVVAMPRARRENPGAYAAYQARQ